MTPVKSNQTFFDEALTPLVESLPEAIFIKDSIGRWLYANKSAKTCFSCIPLTG